MSKIQLRKSLQGLSEVLSGLYELDWFCNLDKYVNYKEPKNTNLVRNNVKHVIGGLSVLYLFAIFESYFDNKYWKSYIEPGDEKILRAYRHVRHSIAHGHHGFRVQPMSPRGQNKDEYDAFDDVIKKNLFPDKIIKFYAAANNRMVLIYGLLP